MKKPSVLYYYILPTLPFTICQPKPSAEGMIVVAECKITKECLELALLMWIINASLRGGIVTVQHCGAEPFQKLVVTQYVDIDLSLIYLY